MNLIKSERICRISASVIVLMCALLMSGCDRGPKTPKAQTTPASPAAQTDQTPHTSVGKYLRKNSPQDYTELKSDGTYIIYQSDYKGNGKYEIDGKRLLLTLKSGVVAEGKIEAKTITDNRGNVWEKQ